MSHLFNPPRAQNSTVSLKLFLDTDLCVKLTKNFLLPFWKNTYFNKMVQMYLWKTARSHWLLSILVK